MREDGVETGNALGRQGFDWPGGNRIDANPFRPQRVRQIAHVGFQAGLGQTHHVIAGEGAHGAKIAEGENGGVFTILHHVATGLGDGRERVGADIVCLVKTFAGEVVQIVAFQHFLGRERD